MILLAILIAVLGNNLLSAWLEANLGKLDALRDTPRKRKLQMSRSPLTLISNGGPNKVSAYWDLHPLVIAPCRAHKKKREALRPPLKRKEKERREG